MIYVHIPFCASHCTYCAFYSELLRPCARGSESVWDSDGVRAVTDAFVAALGREVETCLEEGMPSRKSTLYIGGGTPSLLTAGQIGRISEKLREYVDFTEFTVEVNPEDIVTKGPEYLSALRGMGVNRISMGVQSFDDEILRRMGRRHRSEQSRRAFRMLRQEGFDNISIDLIFGFEKDLDIDSLRRELLALSDDIPGLSGALPEHISCYQLGVEEGSGLEKMLSKGLWRLPDDEACAQRYQALCAMLRDLGYEHYEISNWARNNGNRGSFRSRHNSGYWTHEPYFGFGPGAHSLIVGHSPASVCPRASGHSPAPAYSTVGICSAGADGNPVQYLRRWNNPDLNGYIGHWGGAEACVEGREDWERPSEALGGWEVLTEEQLRQERIMLGLRTSEGIEPLSFTDADNKRILKALETGLLEKTAAGRIRIPEDRWFVSDDIISTLI